MAIKTIMDFLRPEEREQQRQAAAGMPVNPLTQEPYMSRSGLAGWIDFLSSPLKAGTPLGNVWSQMPSGGKAPLSEGLVPYYTGISAEQVPGVVPAGKAVQSAFESVYGSESPLRDLASALGNTTTPRRGWLGTPLHALGNFPATVEAQSQRLRDRLSELLFGTQQGGQGEKTWQDRWQQIDPSMLSDEARRRYLEYAQGAGPSQGAPSEFDWGGMPKQVPAPSYGGTTPPDFSTALAALGVAPKEPEKRPLAERLGRVLGGAAGAGAMAMRGTSGHASVAAALGGAAGGSAATMAEISREEQTRQDRWQQMVETHKAREAELQASAASAKTAWEQRERLAELSAEQEKARVERQYEMMKAPKMQYLGDGLVSITQWDEKKQMFHTKMVDFFETWKTMGYAAKMATAQKRGEVWIGGETYVKGMRPEMAKLYDMANVRLHTDFDGSFRQQVLDLLSQNGVDVEQLMSMAQIDWKNVEPVLTIGAAKLLGAKTSELINQLENPVARQAAGGTQ